MGKIMVVDDESGIRDILVQYLKFEGFECCEASNGKQAVELFTASPMEFSLILMDVMMPFVDGITALRMIRENSDIPVILITAKGEEYDKVFGFDLGADDYVVKPFSPKEVMARVKAVLKRAEAKKDDSGDIYQYKDLSVNRRSYEAKIRDEKLPLTPKEFEILCFLIDNKGAVIKRDVLLNNVWGFDFFGDSRTVDTHIKMLRNNLGEYRELIKTIWGVGYRYDED